MKKILSLVLVAMMLALTACGGNSATTTKAPAATTTKAAEKTTAKNDTTTTAAAQTGITEKLCDGPIILTSIGQSSDVDIVETLCGKINLDVYKNSTIKAADLTDRYKTIIFCVGGSSKGLGAAGIDADQELARTKELIAKCNELGITIVAMHTGGSSRRGALSDSFITPAFEAAKIAIVVSEGDTDGFIKAIIDAHGITASYVEKAAECRNVLKTLFGLS